MAKASFTKVGAASAVIDIPPVTPDQTNPVAGPAPAVPTSAVAVIPPAPVAARPAAYADDDSNISVNDVIWPRVNIVQKVGELSNIFDGGAVVLNQTTVLLDGPPQQVKGQQPQSQPNPLRFVVVGFRPTQYVEKTEGGVMGSIVDTVQDVVALGGTTDYNDSKATGRPLFQPMATALVVIERPEAAKEDATNFIYSCEGKDYAVALWSMKGTSYTNAAKILFTARKMGHLTDRPVKTRLIEPERGGYITGIWTLRTLLRAFGSNFAYVPVLRPAEVAREGQPRPVPEETSLEFRAFVKDLIGG